MWLVCLLWSKSFITVVCLQLGPCLLLIFSHWVTVETHNRYFPHQPSLVHSLNSKQLQNAPSSCTLCIFSLLLDIVHAHDSYHICCMYFYFFYCAPILFFYLSCFLFSPFYCMIYYSIWVEQLACSVFWAFTSSECLAISMAVWSVRLLSICSFWDDCRTSLRKVNVFMGCNLRWVCEFIETMLKLAR